MRELAFGVEPSCLIVVHGIPEQIASQGILSSFEQSGMEFFQSREKWHGDIVGLLNREHAAQFRQGDDGRGDLALSQQMSKNGRCASLDNPCQQAVRHSLLRHPATDGEGRHGVLLEGLLKWHGESEVLPNAQVWNMAKQFPPGFLCEAVELADRQVVNEKRAGELWNSQQCFFP